MNTSNARWATAAVSLLLAACTAEPQPQDEAPPPAEPSYQLPEVWGATPLEDASPDPDIVESWLFAHYMPWDLGDGLEIAGMAYNGLHPGALLQAKVGDEVVIHFTNQLAEPTTVHWHGLRISDQMDGSPRVQSPVTPGGTFEYRFVVPEAGSFWYHPHVAANLQIELGLYAPLVVHGVDDPKYDLERYLVLDDILLDEAGDPYPFMANHMEAMHGRYGNILLVNGKQAGELRGQASQGQVERWRIVNSANARTMKLTIEGATTRVIGTDGGLLPEPYLAPELIVPVGQRYDVEVSYDAAGTARMSSHVLTVDDNDNVVEVPIEIFAVDVAASGEVPRAVEWPALEPRPARAPDATADITFDGVQSTHGLEWQLNGMSHSEMPLFTFQEGQTVRMTLRNLAGPEHPFHLHGQFFEVLGDATQPGLKDTVLIPGLTTVEVLAYFDNPGRWMAHCHILEHAELGMMSEIIVEPTPAP